jgi:hypothetical protein
LKIEYSFTCEHVLFNQIIGLKNASLQKNAIK